MSLTNFLSREKSLLLSFVALLEQEREIMTAASLNGEMVINISAQKQSVVDQLNHMENQRVDIQKKMGYKDGLEGAGKAALDAGCSELWDEIVSIAYRAKQLNESNGEFVRLRMEQNQKVVNFLRDATLDSVYGPDGKTRRKGSRGINSMA